MSIEQSDIRKEDEEESAEGKAVLAIKGLSGLQRSGARQTEDMIRKAVPLGRIYKTTSDGGMNLVPDAFQGSIREFPAQVLFEVHKACIPLQQNEFRHAIEENYTTRRHEFRNDLSAEQVATLEGIFCPVGSRDLPRRRQPRNIPYRRRTADRHWSRAAQ
ncbi:hypothetical protein GOP47_0011224 [Adiantum capillus-veneris]|uniref:DCD domain-containing protein n=1 Tax=Adiantum capillus-veneris TaxID=13818 RepID=A0A9D4ZHN1_ADICA|nr:hypothetical protein GOP47_0011224 [Adiantum capillus-veneris]